MKELKAIIEESEVTSYCPCVTSNAAVFMKVDSAGNLRN